MKRTTSIVFGMSFVLLSLFSLGSELAASLESPNVQSYSGGGWVSAPTGETSFDQITLSAKGRIQYWLFWEKIQGKWTLLFRIRRAPPDPSVSKEEADTLNNIYGNKSSGTISVHHGNGGSSLEGTMESPREMAQKFGTIGK
jgi:hypothetical protein